VPLFFEVAWYHFIFCCLWYDFFEVPRLVFHRPRIFASLRELVLKCLFRKRIWKSFCASISSDFISPHPFRGSEFQWKTCRSRKTFPRIPVTASHANNGNLIYPHPVQRHRFRSGQSHQFTNYSESCHFLTLSVPTNGMPTYFQETSQPTMIFTNN
jgi:hypothetical protein